MKTTLSVNIGGMSFVVDDDAYARLNTYIEALKRKYSRKPVAKRLSPISRHE